MISAYIPVTAKYPYPGSSLGRRPASLTGHLHFNVSEESDSGTPASGSRCSFLVEASSLLAFPFSIDGTTTCVVLQVQNLKVYAELLSLSPSLNTLPVPGPPYAP